MSNISKIVLNVLNVSLNVLKVSLNVLNVSLNVFCTLPYLLSTISPVQETLTSNSCRLSAQPISANSATLVLSNLKAFPIKS